MDKEGQLDMELMKCGEHQKALDLFTEWLTEVESRQARQRPFSIDYKAVKQQLQVQQVLGQQIVYIRR